MTLHRQVRIEYKGTSAEVDEGIAPVVLALWKLGVRTVSSCEDSDGISFVGFPTAAETKKAHRAIKKRTALTCRTFEVTDEDYANATPEQIANTPEKVAGGIGFSSLGLPEMIRAFSQTGE